MLRNNKNIERETRGGAPKIDSARNQVSEGRHPFPGRNESRTRTTGGEPNIMHMDLMRARENDLYERQSI